MALTRCPSRDARSARAIAAYPVSAWVAGLSHSLRRRDRSAARRGTRHRFGSGDADCGARRGRHCAAASAGGGGRSCRGTPRRDIPARSARLGSRPGAARFRSEEHTSELQSLMRISYAVFCLKKKNTILYQIKLNVETRVYNTQTNYYEHIHET